MRGLYAIVDTDALARRGIAVLPFVEAVIEVKPAVVQLRDKHGGARATLELLRSMAPLCSRAGVPLFANDRPDLALLARCDGIHLGRDDVPASLVRSLAPSAEHRLRIGLSTHNEADVDDALREAPDYIAVGPVFATLSKEKPSPVIGPSGLRALTSRIKRAKKDMPVVAIGGISLETAGQIGAVVDCVAVISALLPESEGPPSLDAIRDRARALHAAALGGEG